MVLQQPLLEHDENEENTIHNIFRDDLKYDISLRELISRGILASPVFKELATDLNFGDELNLSDIKKY